MSIFWKLVITVFMTLQFTEAVSPILKTDALPNKCVVKINGKEIVKNIGDTWNSTEPCINFECSLDDNGTPFEKKYNEKCSTDCPKEFEYIQIKGRCCGECQKTKCTYGNKEFKIGDTWRSQDECTLFECTKLNEMVSISTFKKSCPPLGECAEEDLYEENCCKYCRKDPLQQFDVHPEDEDSKNEFSYKIHPCARRCIAGSPPRICEYTFKVEWYETLSKDCGDCPHNITDCARVHCIVGDGTRRSVLVINRMMPGPTIEVCVNDTIIVDVKNRLLGESTTLHWHGLHQRATPYMDGVPHISQCPIAPHTTFRYTFIADQPGTHFWHSHTGMQRGDGSFGALIIRQPVILDRQAKNFDYDLSEHLVVLQDWGHIPGISMFNSHHHSIGDNKPSNILINGKGRYQKALLKNETVLSEQSIKNNQSVSTEKPFNKNSMKPLPKPSKKPTNNNDLGDDVDLFQNETDSNMKFDMNSEEGEEEDENVRRVKREIKVDDMNLFPLEKYRVIQGFRYRFRIINAGFLNCPLSLSIDNHTLTIISSDGYDLQPVQVASVVNYAGERFDLVVHADQPIGNYWMRIKGLMDCDERFTSAHQVAILHYEGAPDEEPIDTPKYDYRAEGIELNSLNKGPGTSDHLCISQLTSLHDDEEWLKRTPDYKLYIYYDFYRKNNPHFNSKLFTPQLNHISFRAPALPLMPAKDNIDPSIFCNASSLMAQGIDCRKEYCECTQVLQINKNAVVEIILIDEGVTYDANHPFHLHGNSFRVIGMDRRMQNTSVEQIQKLDAAGLIKRNVTKAPIKDTVTIPDGGYTIIRFMADNPGYWLFHCHIEFHAEIGMALVFKVGDSDDMPPVPRNFPTCTDYKPKLPPNFQSSASAVYTVISLSWLLAIKLILL